MERAFNCHLPLERDLGGQSLLAGFFFFFGLDGGVAENTSWRYLEEERLFPCGSALHVVVLWGIGGPSFNPL